MTGCFGFADRSDSIYSRWVWPVSIFLLLLPILVSMVPIISGPQFEIVQSGDNALLEMATADVKEGVYTGAYSRFGFHHPGPLYFYLRYPFYAISGKSALSFYIVTTLIAGLSLWGSFRIIRKTASSASAVVFSAVFAFYMFSLTNVIWLNQWNPFIIIFPVCLSVIAVAASAGGAARYFPLAALSISFAAQTHLGVLPSMGLLVVYGIFMSYYRRELQNRYFVTFMVIVFVLWIPVIVDQLSPSGSGNISMISSFLREHSSNGISRASITTWTSSATSIELSLLGPWIREHSLSIARFQFLIAAARSLLLFAAWILVRRRKNSRFETHLCEVTMVLTIASLISVFNIRGEAYQYITVWISVVSPLSWLSILLASSRILIPLWRKILPVLSFVFLLLFTVLSVRNAVAGGFSSDPVQYNDITVSALTQKLSGENELLNSSQIQILIENDVLWPEMAGLACSLRKLGYEISIQQNFSFMLNTSNPVFAEPLKIFLYQGSTGIEYRLADRK